MASPLYYHKYPIMTVVSTGKLLQMGGGKALSVQCPPTYHSWSLHPVWFVCFFQMQCKKGLTNSMLSSAYLILCKIQILTSMNVSRTKNIKNQSRTKNIKNQSLHSLILPFTFCTAHHISHDKMCPKKELLQDKWENNLINVNLCT